MIDEIKEQLEEVQQEDTKQSEVDKRSELNIQKFMEDMRMLGEQVNDRNLIKPVFHYGDASVTNYLLWLVLGELMSLNDKLEENE